MLVKPIFLSQNAELVGLLLDFRVSMVLHSLLRDVKGLADSETFFEEQFVEVFTENDGGLVVELFSFQNANNVFNTRVQKDFARELRVARRNEHELQRALLNDFLQLFLEHLVGRDVVILKDKVAIVPEVTVAREVQPHRLV